MTLEVAIIIWILLSIIAALSVLLLYAVYGVNSRLDQMVGEQRISNKLLREIAGSLTNPDNRTSLRL